MHEASCSDGQIKLIEGYTELYGRVEICSHQRWETLSYNHWSSSVAKVVCIELGYSSMFTLPSCINVYMYFIYLHII